MTGLNVAILGATGLVGGEFIKILEQRRFPMDSVRLLATERSAGRKLSVNGVEVQVEEAGPDSFRDIDVALFSAGAGPSRHFAPLAAAAGAVVIDNSSAFRMEADVPLVVPEVNPDDAAWHHGIIANPNCSTIQMVVALWPLHRVNRIRRIVVATYQSVSGTGSAAVEALTQETRQVLDGTAVTPHVYPHQIAFNMLPHIDVFLDNGYTREEWKMVEETRKIMHAPEMAVTATCVRVPVYRAHSEAVHIELDHFMQADTARELLAHAPGVKLLDDPSVDLYPMPWQAENSDEVYVGRIRADASHEKGLALWVVSDNLRKGAALNAVQIAELVAARGWIKPEERRGEQ
jgi:aspartate-semialdehyde dehydrogenase